MVRHKADSPILSSVALRSPVEFQSGLVANYFPQASTQSGSDSTNHDCAAVLRCFIPATFLVELPAGGGLPLELRGLGPDVLIIEGSYGGSSSHRRSQENQLAERINRAIAASYLYYTPTPTLGLGRKS